jgi:hypothetical protein
MPLLVTGLRAKYRAFVAAWLVAVPALALCALAVSPLAWIAVLAAVIGGAWLVSRVFRCPECDAALRLVRPARLWPPRTAGFSFPARCHRCGADLLDGAARPARPTRAERR